MLAPVKTCTACPLHKSAITNCIPGRGPTDAKIMIVAQGPGGTEDMKGQVLIGRSGQMLDEMLRDAGYDPDEVFKTNATRCRAPSDRAPTPSEIDACRVHLADEIRRVRPSAIIALGDSALRSLCKLSGIQSKRGKAYPLHPSFLSLGDAGAADAAEIASIEVWPTYHPAFVLRAPHAQNVVTSDLRRVRDRATEHEVIPWARFDRTLPKGDVWAYDIETIGVNGEIVPYPTQIAIAGDDCVVVSHEPDKMRAMTFALMMFPGTLVGHNSWDFDRPRLEKWFFEQYDDK